MDLRRDRYCSFVSQREISGKVYARELTSTTANMSRWMRIDWVLGAELTCHLESTPQPPLNLSGSIYDRSERKEKMEALSSLSGACCEVAE